MKLSVVIPVLNEASNVALCHGQIRASTAVLNAEIEIIFVDDGSSDGTSNAVAELHKADALVKLIRLTRNFGHQMALTAGMDAAQGDAVITMDGDLQHPPDLIPAMVQEWRRGAKIVYTMRQSHGTLNFKTTAANMFYRLFGWLSPLALPPNAADFRLLDRDVLKTLVSLRERNRFLRGLVPWTGFQSVGLSYRARKRQNGASKYNFRRQFEFALNGLVSFSAAPLYASVYAGALFSLLGIGDAGYALYMRLVSGKVVPGWTSILVLVSLLGGIQLMVLGLIGIYIGKIYEETKQRPLYVIRETLGLAEPPR